MLKQYLHNILIGLDQFGASIFFNRNDLTISAICGLVLNNNYLNLNKLQIIGCIYLGKLLNIISTGHTQGAINGDRTRAQSTLTILG